MTRHDGHTMTKIGHFGTRSTQFETIVENQNFVNLKL